MYILAVITPPNREGYTSRGGCHMYIVFWQCSHPIRHNPVRMYVASDCQFFTLLYIISWFVSLLITACSVLRVVNGLNCCPHLLVIDVCGMAFLPDSN